MRSVLEESRPWYPRLMCPAAEDGGVAKRMARAARGVSRIVVLSNGDGLVGQHDADASDTAELTDPASVLARRLGVVVAPSIPPGGAALAWHEGRMELRGEGDRPGRGVCVDAEWILRELGRGGNVLRGDPLARAIGRAPQRVVDATAGLGGDALLLAALGHDVVAFERDAIVHALLQDGLRVLSSTEASAPVVDRITLRAGSAIDLLPALSPPPEVVLLDPMYRETGSTGARRRSTALPPKSMQRLRLVVGDDLDDAQLLAAARAVATRRVVVKRGDGMAPLADAPPSWSIEATTVRYDVYRVASLA